MRSASTQPHGPGILTRDATPSTSAREIDAISLEMTEATSPERPTSGRSRPAALGTVLLLGWFTLIAVLGGALALRMSGFPVLGDAQATFWDRPMLAVGALVGAVCLGMTLAVRWLRPAATLPMTLAVVAAVVLGGAVATGSLMAIVPVLVITGLSWLVGQALVTRLSAPDAPGWITAIVAVALGNGLLGLLLLLLASTSSLNAATVVTGALVLLLAIAVLTLRRPVRIPRGPWGLPTLTWFETVLLGITGALVAYALLSTFVPEHASDAVRAHLPIAREFWQQQGRAPAYPELWPSAFPIHAHLLYAPAWGFGGMAGVKLVHAAIGLLSVVAVAGLGWLLAGRLAGLVAAAIFATLPIALWELGHAYVDLFPAFFLATATLAALVWQRGASRTWLVLAGALAAFAFAAKMTSGPYPVALAAVIVLVGREHWNLRSRVLDVLAFMVGASVILPWLLRSYVLTGAIPGIDLLVDAIFSEPYALGANLANFGVGRHPLDVLRIPWDMTFDGGSFGEATSGAIGLALLLTLPLILLVPRTRASAFLLALAAIGFVGWAYTAQYIRYGLPLFAIVAVLCGAGVARATTFRSRGGRLVARALPLLLIALAVTPVLWLPVWGRGLPAGLFSGSQSREEWLTTWVRGHAMLVKAGELLPEDTPVGWVGGIPADQIYSEARMAGLPPSLGTSPQEVLDGLASQGIDYVIWERVTTAPRTGRRPYSRHPSSATTRGSLARRTAPTCSRSSTRPGDRWGLGADNLLLDPEFVELGEDGPWWWSSSREAAVAGPTLAGGDTVSQDVAVTEGGPYLLDVTASCETQEAPLNLSLRWLDDHDALLALTWELVVPGAAAQ